MRTIGIVVGSLVIAVARFASAQPGIDPNEQQMPPQQMPPQQMPPQPPRGSSHVSFLSASALQWDVWINEQTACATPCQLWVPPGQFISLHTHEDQPVRLEVGYLYPGEQTLTASPLAQGEYAGGIVATTFAAMGLVTGITLTAVGYGTSNNAMTTAGIITGIPSAIGLYAGIWLMRDALPKFSIGAARPYFGGNQVGFAGHF